MINTAEEMLEHEKRMLLTEYCEYDADEVEEMTEEELNDAVDAAIENFREVVEDEIRERYNGIDIDDEDITLYEIYSMKADIDDDSDLYPNGRDYDAEDFDD